MFYLSGWSNDVLRLGLDSVTYKELGSSLRNQQYLDSTTVIWTRNLRDFLTLDLPSGVSDLGDNRHCKLYYKASVTKVSSR